ncbi:hypothetical protein DFS34DRAFT_614520 [Phlyctochytrium arcticum]|nr:hypothetical protein DFS34DRAFT_614520 [Phlyctochytrium arcticum]
MAATSVAFFSGNQSALELANYIGVAKGEPSENGPFSQQAQKLLANEQYLEVFTKFADESAVLLEADEKDFEGIYNLLIALIKDAQPEQNPQLLTKIINPIVASGSDKAALKLKVLSNLYNNLETNSPVRYDIFVAILKVAAQGGELDVVTPHLSSLDSWIAEWGISLNQRRAFYLLLSQKLEEGEFTQQAFDYLLKYLSTFDNADAKALAEAKPHAIRAVKDAIRISTVLDFEDLFKLQAVQALKPNKLFDLLKIFLNESLQQYQAFVKANPKFIAEQGLSEEDNLNKMRLLSMVTLAADHVQGEVAYDTIATALDIPDDEVEIWVINVIRAGLMDAKMNQLKRTVVVGRTVHRVFSEAEWKQLSEKLNAWRNNIKDVLQVIANAKLIAGSQGATIETAINA